MRVADVDRVVVVQLDVRCKKLVLVKVEVYSTKMVVPLLCLGTQMDEWTDS